MKLDTFINRPVLSTVISIFIVLLGLIGLSSLPITQYPDIAPPTISVSTTYAGANAQAVAEFLAGHPKISWVNYAGLPGNRYHDLARKYMPNGTCGVVSFGVKGGRKAAETFMKHLKLAAIETHVADARTCCLHPASATHRQMNDAELVAAGITPDLVRMSCGIEDAADLIADIEQALAQV